MESGAVALFPSALFLFAENPVAVTPCCRIDLSVSLAEHEGVLVIFFLDLMEESVARPSVGMEDLCSLGMLYCLKRSADGVCAFCQLSETSQKWHSHQSLGSMGTRRVSHAYRDSESPERCSSGRHISDFGDGDVHCPSRNT